jgi:hypothetical protein
MEKERQDAILQATLRTRSDLPPKQLARLVEIAQEQARRTLTEELGAEAAGAVDAAVSEAASTVAQGVGTGLLTGNFDAALAAVERKVRASGLVEDDIGEWLRAGKIEEALAAIAHLAGVPIPIVVKAYRSPHYDPLLFLVRALKFGWGTFKALLAAKAGRQPSAETLRSAFEAFQQLSVQTAQRVERFTAAREKAAQTDAA